MARDAELRFLRDCYAEASTPGVVVVGGAGVGKSRLLREAFADLDRPGRGARLAIATRTAASIPFGCLAHLIPSHLGATPSDRFSLFNAVASALLAESGDARVALVVDDAHLLDPAGAALVFHLANVRAAFVCVAVRNGEPIPDAVRALWKDAGSRRIDLEPIGREETRELVERALGGQVEEASIDALWGAAAGNIMFLREIVHASVEAGSLGETGGLWRWSGEIPASTRLVELVEAHIGRLDDGERRALEILALGEPLGARALEQLAGVREVAALERRGLIATIRDGRREVARLSHPLYGEILRPAVPSAEARAIRLALAERAEAAGLRRRGDLLRAAAWRLEAGRPGDPELLTEAAYQASHSFDPDLAIRFATTALDAGAGARAAIALAEALIMNNRFEEAEAALAPHEQEALAADEARHYLFQRTLALHWGLGRSDELDPKLRSARSARDDPAWRQQVDGLRAQVLAFEGPLDEAVRLAAPLVEDPASDRWARLYGVSAVVTQLTFSGQTERALEVLAPYAELALELAEGFPHGPAWITALQATALTYAGRLDEVEALLEALLRMAGSVGDDQARGGALMGLGIVALHRGALDRAVRLLREAVAPLRRSDLAGLLPWTYSSIARAEGERGDGAAARAAARLAAEARGKRPGNRLHAHDDVAAEAWAAAASGHASRGRELALEGAARLSELPVNEALLLVTALRLGAPISEVAPRLVEICEGGDGVLLGAYGGYASALLDGAGGAIERAGSALEQVGHLLRAAEAYARASIAFADEARADSARRAAARATALIDGYCPGARTPALAQLSAPELTPREREIAELATNQLANAEIAERLVVSVRTVEWHLQQVYGKLGVGGREELTAVLGAPDGPHG